MNRSSRPFLTLVLTLGLVSFARGASAFIPPLGPVTQKIFAGHKLPATAEFLFRHRVEVRQGSPVEIEERMYVLGGRPRFVFRVGGRSYVATREGNGYRFPSVVIESRSGLYLKSLLSRRGEEFLERAIAEQFIRRDQLNQFSPNYGPSGDPKTWRTAAAYIRHADISLARLPQGTAICATNGGDARNPARALYIDKDSRGVSRLEWRDGENRHQWDFQSFTTYKREGTFPNRMVYRLDGQERVRTDLLAVKAVSERQASDALRGAESPSDDAKDALAVLLGMR